MRLLAFLLCLLPAAAHAQNERAPEIPELKVEVITAGGEGAPVYVQQQVLLKVTLISRFPFKTLQIETPLIANAETHVASRAKTSEFSTYGGSGWRHQRISALFPRNSGTWILPSITATGAATRPDGTTLGFELVSPPHRIDVQPAHPYLNGFWWVAAEDISLSEEWSRDLTTMKIGDTVRRTVRIIATGTTDERLPDVQQRTTPGLSVHDAGGTRTTRFTPGGAIAEVRRSWDITVNTDDPVNIAPISVSWWHTGESRPASSGTPAGRIEPLAIDGRKLRADLLAEATAERDSRAYLLLGLVILLASPAVILACLALAACLPTWADFQLHRALRRAATNDCAPSVVRWGRSAIHPSIRTMGEIAHLAPPEAARLLRALQTAAYGAKVTGAADLTQLTRWSRRVRLQRLRLRLARLTNLAAGNAGSG